FGVAAVELIAEGKFGRMVTLSKGEMSSCPIEDAVGKLKTVDPNGELVRMARSIGICLGDCQNFSFSLVRLVTRILISLVLLLALGCGSQDNSRAEYAYVSVP